MSGHPGVKSTRARKVASMRKSRLTGMSNFRKLMKKSKQRHSLIRPANIVMALGSPAAKAKSTRVKKANKMAVEVGPSRRSTRSVKGVNRYDPKKQEQLEKEARMKRIQAAAAKAAEKKAALAAAASAAAAAAAQVDLDAALGELTGLLQGAHLNSGSAAAGAGASPNNMSKLMANLYKLRF